MILQLAAETFVRLIKIIILFTGGRTFVREFTAHNAVHSARIGKIFVKIVPAHRDTPPATPPPTHMLHHDAAHPAHGRSSQMQLTAQLTYLTIPGA